MRWRREGADEPGDASGLDAADDTPVTMADVLSAQRACELEEGNGESVYEILMGALQQMQGTDQARRMAVYYRQFSERIKTALRRLIEQRGADYVVTPQDIYDMFRSLPHERAAERAAMAAAHAHAGGP